MQKLISFLAIFSIWTSLFAPISLAQNSNSVSNIAARTAANAANAVSNSASSDTNFFKKNSDEPEKEQKGLQFRVREGKPDAPKPTPTPVSASKLNQIETDSILKRLAPLPVEEKSDFKISSQTLPPPKTGTIINTKFPADESQPTPSTVDSKTLEVLRYSPNGNVGITPEISVTFSQPMIAVTSQEEVAQNVPVNLSPSVKGKWRWLGTRTLIFDAETRLPMATKFTAKIPKGTKSINGQILEKEVSWGFSTAPPKVEAFSAKDLTVKRDENLFAAFDQEINPADVLAKIALTANGKKIALRLLTEAEMSKEIEEIKNNKPEFLKRFMGFRAVELLPADSTIYVTFEKGLPSAEGSLTMTEAKSFSFKTFGLLKVAKSYCGYNEKGKICPKISRWLVKFNNPLDVKSFDKSQIKIEPPIKNVSYQIWDNELNVYGVAKPKTTHKVTISGNIKDEFGQTLGQDFSTTFTVGGEEPNLVTQYQSFFTLDARSKPFYSIYSTNYSSLRVKIYSVKPEDYSSFLAFKDNEKTTYPTFGKLVFNQSVKVKNIADEQVETAIDLSSALTNGVGHAVLVVEPPVGKQSRFGKREVKWFQITNIGLDAFGDYEQLAVYTSNLKDGKPLSNVQLMLSNGASGVSVENGLASLKLPPRVKKKSNYLIAKLGADSAILTRNVDYDDFDYDSENEYDDNQNAGWSASPKKDNLRWFVFDDRKMYRPGETVSVKGYLRKATGGKLADVGELADVVSGLSYVLKDAQQNEIAKGTAKLNLFGAFDLQLKLPENINLGYQQLEFTAVSKLDGNEFTHQFQAQEFRRPEFEVETNVESAAPFILGDSATVSTHAKYFSGGGLANAEADWDISASPTNYTPPNRDDWTFGKFSPWWTENYDGESYSLRSSQDFKGKTDVEGKHWIALDFLKANPARPYKIETRANVQDVNRQTFSGSTSLLVHPSKLYVGLKTPKTFVQAGENFKIETIVTDLDGKSIANAPVNVTAELKDWQQEKGEWKQVTIDTQKCQVQSANEAVSCNFTAKQGGTYIVTARVLDETERPNESEITVWVAGGKRDESENVDEAEIELIPDKKEYAPNETAEILLNAPFFPAEGVLTLERNGIVKTERFTLEKSSTVLKIPIEERYLPNVHIQVTLVGATLFDADNAKSPKVPAYATGELNLEVSTASRKLNVTAEPVNKILPPAGQTKINVAVTDNYGKAVANSEVALVAVDESILALTGYKIDNPLDIFYEQLEAETNSTHSRKDLRLNGISQRNNDIAPVARAFDSDDDLIMNRQGVAANAANTAANAVAMPTPRTVNMARTDEPIVPNQITTKGEGDQNSSIQMMQLRRNFAATAIFAPSVKTDATGKATIDLKLPDNLTRYRITAVAVTKSKQFGLGESNLTAKQPLQIRPSAPRFLNFGDKAEIPVVVQNQTDTPMTVNVAIRSSNATLTDGNGKKVTVAANDRAEISFPVTAQNVGIARFQIGAISEKYADAAEIEFPVYTPATTESFATYGTTDQNGAIVQPVSAPKDVYSQFGGLEISASSTQLQELTDAFIYLQNYPFECSEQIASRILSVAALRDVLTAFNAKDLPSKNEIESKMKSDIERLQKLQHTDGGFSFWRNNETSIPFVTVHVAHALARAKAKGFVVPKEVTAKVSAYLKAIESKTQKLNYSQESKWAISAYAIYVRDLLGDRDAVKAQIILKSATLEKLSPETLGWFLSVFANDKSYTIQADAIKKHLLNRVTETADKANFINNYTDGEYVLLSSNRRTDGVILESLLKSEGGNATVKERVSNANDTLPNGRVSATDLIPKIVRGLLANRVKGRWSSTQENAFVLLALDEYFRKFEKATPNFVSKIWLGNSYAGEQKFVGRSTATNLINVPMSYLQGQQNLILDKQGAGRLYYRIGLKYAPKNLNLAAANYGFEVSRQYEAIDNPNDVKQLADGSWTIKAGSRIRVKVQMVNTANRYHVALVDYLPAGFEIINSELANSSSTGEKTLTFWNWFDHQNLRDNRTEAFSSYLNSGVWEYKYVVRATTLGNFVAPPAKAEEMYSPETFGRSKTDFVRVE